MVEGSGGSEGRGGRRTALSGGGRRRDSQVWRSACRLDQGLVSVIAFLLMFRRRGVVHTGLFGAQGLVSWLGSKGS